MSTIQENMIEIGIRLSAIESKLGINQITYREVANGEIIQECFENFDFLTNRWKPTVFRWIDKAIVQSPLTYRCPINVEPIFPEKKYRDSIEGEIIQSCFEFYTGGGLWKKTDVNGIVDHKLDKYRVPINVEPIFLEKKYRDSIEGEIIQSCFEFYTGGLWKKTDRVGGIVDHKLDKYRVPINVEPIFPEKKFEITIPNSCRTCPVSYCHMQSQYYTKIDCKIRLFEYFLSKKD